MQRGTCLLVVEDQVAGWVDPMLHTGVVELSRPEGRITVMWLQMRMSCWEAMWMMERMYKKMYKRMVFWLSSVPKMAFGSGFPIFAFSGSKSVIISE